jgi:hypothetical protein
VDEGSHVSRHGLRLLADAKSWSDTNGLADVLVPLKGVLFPLQAPHQLVSPAKQGLSEVGGGSQQAPCGLRFGLRRLSRCKEQRTRETVPLFLP